jgi:hypothetical protein
LAISEKSVARIIFLMETSIVVFLIYARCLLMIITDKLVHKY